MSSHTKSKRGETEAMAAILDQLSAPNQRFAERYPGAVASRQPIHTVYGGAQLFGAETCDKLGALSRAHMDTYAGDPFDFARAIGGVQSDELPAAGAATLAMQRFVDAPEKLQREEPAVWLALTVYQRVRSKLARQAVEDFRIDFEDGFGTRPHAEEDATAKHAATELARAMASESIGLPPFIGIRIKSLSEECKARSVRTLDIFITTLVRQSGGVLPRGFVITLPKVTIAEQPAALVRILEHLEGKLQLDPGSLRMEIMIEVTQALMAANGRSSLPDFLEACGGRCVGAHLGTYDFTASCDVTAAHQRMDHPLCDQAKAMMTFAYAGTGIFLSDGASNVMPIGPHRGRDLSRAQLAENRLVVHRAWRLAYGNIRHSLANGFYQGWDLHPGQLPVRYAACYGFFLEGLADAAARLKNFIAAAAQATRVGDVFDDAATGQGLLNTFLRAYGCGAIDVEDFHATGLTREEIQLRSFAKILAARHN